MKSVSLIILITFFALLGYFSIWGVCVVGDIPFEKIVFHMFMPLKKTHTEWATMVWLPVLGAIVTALVLALWLVVKQKTEKKTPPFGVLLLLCVILDGWYINKHFFMWDFIKSQYESSNFIERHYVSPKTKQITFPKDKKNLIIIMVESLETSYQDKDNGGLFDKNYIPELTHLAQENITFSHSDKIEGAMVPPEAGWTIAGTVAQTAGVPLKLYDPLMGNSMGQFKYFLPGVVSLGDILAENGYRNYFILGTDARFAGTSDYLSQHGSYTILDNRGLNHPNDIIYDADLLKMAKGILTNVSQNEPFSVLIQTIDTHFAPKEAYEKTSKYVDSFIKWLQDQPFYKDTVVVIIGDHCNMRQQDFNGLEQKDFRYMGNRERKVYNAFINADAIPTKATHRKFSTFDMFPTILASLGVQIEGNKLGLGTNLFSDEKTLLEVYDPIHVFGELKKNSRWYNRYLLRKNHP